MALLDETNRVQVWAEFMRDESRDGQAMGLTKADLRAAADAADDWADANAASFNAALPQPARSALTARQKAKLLVAVLDRRYKVL